MTDLHRPAGLSKRSLLARVVTAVIYGVVLLGAIVWGSLPLGIVIGVLAAIAAAEFYAMTRREHGLPNELVGALAAGLMPIAAALWGMAGLATVVTGLIAVLLVWQALMARPRTADTALSLFGAVYTGFLLAYLVLIRGFGEGGRVGLVLTLAVVVSVWVNDSLAYFVGSAFGRHKMAPRVSPHKSWEGFAGGVFGTMAVWIAVPFLPWKTVELPWAVATGIAVALSVVVGDLAESRIKREAGVKDSGRLLPGHGGSLDRHDSLILVAAVAWWMLWWGGIR